MTMGPGLCSQCRHPLAEGSRFCGQCGAVTALRGPGRPEAGGIPPAPVGSGGLPPSSQRPPPVPPPAEAPHRGLGATIPQAIVGANLAMPPKASGPVDLSSTMVDRVPAGLRVEPSAEPARLRNAAVTPMAPANPVLAPPAAPIASAPSAGVPKGAQRTMVGYALSDDQLAAAQRAQAAARASSPSAGPLSFALGPSASDAIRPPLAGPLSAAEASASPSRAPDTPSLGGGQGPGPSSSGSSPPLASVKRTMVGVAVGDVGGAAARPAVPLAPSGPDGLKGTMLGVAIPGIAPLAASAPASQGLRGTMLGVAVPGIAPTVHDPAPLPSGPAAPQRAPLRRAVEIAPMPPPLVDEPDVGPPPQLVKRGLPLAWVAGILGVVAAIGGVAAFLLLRSPPLIAQPKIDAQGHEMLHLSCKSCDDGTTAELYETKTTFKNQEADLPLATPLKVGNNPLTIVLDRPKLGRDESVQVVVPVVFRIRSDLADLSAARPAITVHVQAVAGTEIKVDGKPVTLDAAGDGTYSVDISTETEGPADELRMIDRVIPYSIVPRNGEGQVGKLTVRVGIAPLHLDAPGLHAVVEGGSFRVTGRTLKGGTVTANGSALKIEADGTFAQPLDITSVGDLPIEVRASAPQLAPRTAHFAVKRVDHLADEAKAREAQPAATYDDIASDLKAAVGKTTIVEGDVVETRTTSALTVAVVDDNRGCSHAPCLVRITYGGDARFKHGDTLRAYGRVTRAFPYNGSNVPEIEADFVQLGHPPKR
jgi:hypothetical protein